MPPGRRAVRRRHAGQPAPGRAPAAAGLRAVFVLAARSPGLAAARAPGAGVFLEDEAAGQTVAQLYVVPDFEGPGLARSPGQASFGGVQLAAGLPVAALHQLLAAVEATLLAHGQAALEVRGYPFCHDPAGAARLAEALRQRGYQVSLAEQNYYLDLARDYAAHLHPSARRRWRAAQRAGLVLEQEPRCCCRWPTSFWRPAGPSAGSRRYRCHWCGCKSCFGSFHGSAFPVGARVGQRAVGGAHGGHPGQRAGTTQFLSGQSVGVQSIKSGRTTHGRLHQLGRDLGLRVVDLGRSTLGNQEPHESLLRFKRHLGGVASLKLTWRKTL
ncbi:MAG: hypothetical protein WKG07_17865 [Hymenobacter sp.]